MGAAVPKLHGSAQKRRQRTIGRGLGPRPITRKGGARDEGIATARDLLARGRALEAAQALRKLAEKYPGDIEILDALGRAFTADRQWLRALQAYERIHALGQESAHSWYQRANALSRMGEQARSLDAYEQSLGLDPDDLRVHIDYGRALFELGQVDRACEHLSWAASRSESDTALIDLASMIPGAPGAHDEQILEVRQALADRLRERRALRTIRAPRMKRAPGELIRVAYLSAHFGAEHDMKPVWALMNRHDRDLVQIHLLVDGPRPPAMHGYVAHPQDRVHHVGGLTDGGIEDLLERHEIDVLVDLSGYSHPARLSLFARELAPTVVGWFDVNATSGLPGIDYLLGDHEVVSEEEAEAYSERVVRLPQSYLGFHVAHDAPGVAPPPCERNGYITFGSLASQSKLTETTLDAWAKILRKVPNARLVLANRALGREDNRKWVREGFARRKISPERISLLGPTDRRAFLRYYDRIDIALDPLECNGGPTTMEAIWQGVPVLTTEGDRWAARTSRTLLRRTHLGEWVAPSVRAMIRQAVGLARDPRTPTRLAALRREMRERLAHSSACDAEGLARSIERFFEGVARERVAASPGRTPA